MDGGLENRHFDLCSLSVGAVPKMRMSLSFKNPEEHGTGAPS